jgi:hypothetical protein
MILRLHQISVDVLLFQQVFPEITKFMIDKIDTGNTLVILQKTQKEWLRI